jgi:hypothetical protein
MVCQLLRNTQSDELAIKSKMARIETLAISMFFNPSSLTNCPTFYSAKRITFWFAFHCAN